MLHSINSPYIILPFIFIIQSSILCLLCVCAPFVRLFCFLKIYNNTKSCTNFMMFTFSQSFFFIADLMELLSKLTKYFEHLTKPLGRVVVSCTLNIMSLFRNYFASRKHVNINKYLFGKFHAFLSIFKTYFLFNVHIR